MSCTFRSPQRCKEQNTREFNAVVLAGARVLFLVAAFLLLRTGRNLSLRWWRAAATPRVSRPSRPCDVGRVRVP